MRVSSAIALALALSVSACGSTTVLDMGTRRSATRDAAIGTGQDASLDATSDASDAGVTIDGGLDAGASDSGSDAGNDAGMDASADASTDAGSDAGPDAGSCVFGGFAPETTYAFGNPLSSHGTFVTTGDFNHDGSLDLAATNSGGDPDEVGIYLNKGDGSFASEVAYRCGSWPGGIVASDFDGDGFLDLALSNGYPSSNLAILRNLGDGSFSSPAFITTGGKGASGIAAGDMNGDHRPDLVATNYASNTLAVMLNRGSGSFGPPTLYDLSEADSVALGDLDGNGSLDVVGGSRSWYAAQFSTFFNDGSGSLVFGATYTYGTSDTSVLQTTPSLVIGDFDGTGALDLVASARPGVVLVYSNMGDGTLSVPSVIDPGTPAWWLVATDFDGDGRLDLAMPTSAFTSAGQLVQTVDVLLGTGHGAFAAPDTYPDFDPTNGITTGDFNHDGHPDIAVGNVSWVSVLLSECK